MSGYGTYYVGGKHKLYTVRIRIPHESWMKKSDVYNKFDSIIKAVHRDDDTYYFDDEDSLKDIVEWIREDDKFVYYEFLCDQQTYKQLYDNRKYWGFQVGTSWSRWR